MPNLYQLLSWLKACCTQPTNTMEGDGRAGIVGPVASLCYMLCLMSPELDKDKELIICVYLKTGLIGIANDRLLANSSSPFLITVL